jgi:hypothetical protein
MLPKRKESKARKSVAEALLLDMPGRLGSSPEAVERTVLRTNAAGKWQSWCGADGARPLLGRRVNGHGELRPIGPRTLPPRSRVEAAVVVPNADHGLRVSGQTISCQCLRLSSRAAVSLHCVRYRDR